VRSKVSLTVTKPVFMKHTIGREFFFFLNSASKFMKKLTKI